MSGSTADNGLIYYIADFGPWLICLVAFAFNVHAIVNRSKTSLFDARFRFNPSSVGSSAAAFVQMLLPDGNIEVEEETDHLMEELEKRALEEKTPSGSRPLLTFLRDLSIAEALQPMHCSAALVRLAKHGDLAGVQALLMLTTEAGLAITNSMVCDVMTLLCENGGDKCALDIYRSLLIKSDYFLDAPVLELLLRAAARLNQLQEVEHLFKQLHGVKKPSVRAYGLAIHALGQHGAVNDAVSLFEELLVRQRDEDDSEDVSLAWNSLLSVLTRNTCVRRAIAVFERGRAENFRIVPAVALALCEMAPDQIAVPKVWIRSPRSGDGPRARSGSGRCRGRTAAAA